MANPKQRDSEAKPLPSSVGGVKTRLRQRPFSAGARHTLLSKITSRPRQHKQSTPLRRREFHRLVQSSSKARHYPSGSRPSPESIQVAIFRFAGQPAVYLLRRSSLQTIPSCWRWLAPTSCKTRHMVQNPAWVRDTRLE